MESCAICTKYVVGICACVRVCCVCACLFVCHFFSVFDVNCVCLMCACVCALTIQCDNYWMCIAPTNDVSMM